MSRLPSPRLCSGRKRCQFASVSVPCFGVAFRYAAIAPPLPISATDAVPRSVLIGLYPGGYGSADPVAVRAMCQPGGAEAGCSQANGPELWRRLDWPPPQPVRPGIRTTAPTAMATRPGLRRGRLIAQMPPSPSLGPPLLSESWSPPLFCGMPLLGGFGAGCGAAGAGAGFGGGGAGAGFGA